MSETHEEARSVSTTKARMRPRPPGSGWALVIVATVVVILFGIGTWIGLSPLQALLSSPSDHEAVHTVTARMRARWPQVPGPPSRYVEEASRAIRVGEGRAAARKLGMAVALDPDHTEALLLLTILDARGEADGLLDPGEAAGLVSALRAVEAEAPLLSAAAAWRDVAAGNPGAVEAAFGPVGESEAEELLWARLRASRDLGAPEGAAARALLASWPGHPEACEDGAREALRQQDLAEAEALALGCLDGPARAIAARVVADVMVRTGRRLEARGAYTDAGLDLHAASQAFREGAQLTTAEAAALAEPGAPAAIQQAWAAMSMGDAALLRIALDRIPADPSPEFAVTRAAGWLWLGEPGAATASLEGVAGPRAAVLAAGLPGAGAAGAVAAARAAWPALPGADDPVATAMLLGPSGHAIPTELLLRIGTHPGVPLSSVRPWAPGDPRAAALVHWLWDGTPSGVEAGGGDDALGAALLVVDAIAAERDPAPALARLELRAPGSVMLAVLEARAAESPEACVEAVAKAREVAPGLVGLDRERYRCGVRGSLAPQP